MNTFGKLAARDATMLEYIVGSAVKLTIRHREDLEGIADRFFHGDLADAFEHCLEEGIEKMVMLGGLDSEVKD